MEINPKSKIRNGAAIMNTLKNNNSEKSEIMRSIFCLIIVALSIFYAHAKPARDQNLKFFKADDQHISYVGRIDFTDPLKPKFWSPGVYVQAKFEGTSLEIFFNDEQPYDNYNYLEIAIDNQPPFRIKATGKSNHIMVADHLSPGAHTVIICKDTESGMGYIEFLGLKCAKLLTVKKPHHKIEFIGDSITCGSGTDLSATTCATGKWFDEHNAYMSYGPLVARQLDAEWHLTSVSGIGLIHSCCNMNVTMPQVFDKVILRSDSLKWDFNKYTPDVVTICLGQNDGKQDSTAFCSAYVTFINRVRTYYPKADIVCLSSPMANTELTIMLKKYITGIQQYLNDHGDKKVYHYFFTRSYNDGCADHPDMAQHVLIAQQVTEYIKGLEKW